MHIQARFTGTCGTFYTKTLDLEPLTQVNLDDLVSSFGWQDRPRLDRAVRLIFHSAARKFAGQMLEFDSSIGIHGLTEAARLTLRQYVRDVRVFGLDHIPGSAFLALSNHPGMADSLSLFAALNRRDLKIIALERPFLKSLPNTSGQLFYITDDPGQRITLVRQVSRHLRTGGAALTFPAGRIEPDPDVYPGALESLRDWTDSVGVFLRLAPETAVLPILVRNVIWQKAARQPRLKIKKTRDEREKLAAALQLLAMVIFNIKPVTVTVQIGKPVTVQELGSAETQIIHQAVLAQMKQLIENPPEGEGISVS